MEKYVKVPVVDVHKYNLDSIWSGLLQVIYGATFIAVDTELSGLGERKKLMAKSIDDRYKNLVEVAKTRSILAVGISCFQEVKDNPETADNTGKLTSTCYKVHTFNLSVLCNQEFVVEPASLQFLIQHGFDFNKQFSQGISYHKGPDKELCDYTTPSIRNLFAHILLSSKPVVLHNGLLDLVFLYHNFYNTIPDTLEVFTSDVNGMFSGGVLDTKYVAEFKLREPASYLSYIFRKCQRHNTKCKESGQKYTMVEFEMDPSSSQWIEQLYCYVPRDNMGDTSGVQICDLYAAHGFCRRGVECHLSHDIDHILDKEEKVLSKKKRKKKRKSDHEGKSNDAIPTKRPTADTEMCIPTTQEAHVSRPQHINSTENNVAHQKAEISIHSNNITGGHRAGIDAYMTGYCLATYLVQCGHSSVSDSGLINNISLSGKERPLSLTGSHFSKPSVGHVSKMDTIKTKVQFR